MIGFSIILANLLALSLLTSGIHFLFIWRDSPQWARASSFTRLLDHTQRHITVDRTPLDE